MLLYTLGCLYRGCTVAPLLYDVAITGEKARKLVNAIIEAVRRDKMLFQKLVKRFNSEVFYRTMAERLSQEYDRLGNVSDESVSATSDPLESRMQQQAPATIQSTPCKVNREDLPSKEGVECFVILPVCYNTIPVL